ncbi:MAG: HAD hydrolase-like protein [Thermoguttaceae bacterium]|jgi:phosphoglycolate phosphatase-like HAD superfamily hydrolase
MFDFAAQHPWLVGIDSDGCAFDTMELKQKECFTPNTIKFYGLQGVSKYAREACDFVNLYSKSRGINRFPALVEELEWTARRPEVRARGIQVRVPPALKDWVRHEPKLGNPALAEAVRRSDDADLEHALEWSQAVNRAVEDMVHGVPPFPFVRECLEKLAGRADILVVSATPQEALQREWAEHDLAKYVVAILGQESGTKREFLGTAGNYPPEHALMIGDAPGDYKAAVANKALYFPINPGAEEASWRRLFEEGIERFLSGEFAGRYQEDLLAEFERYLPERPPWPVVE